MLSAVVDKVKAYFAREPVVVINSLFALALVVQQAWVASLNSGDAAVAVAWAVVVAAVRHFVSPAVNTSTTDSDDDIYLS